MTLPVLTAVTDAGWEEDLVAALGRRDRGVTVVRRCVDVADLLAAAAAGTGRAVVLSADLRRLDRDVLSRLAASRVAVVGLVEPGDDGAERRLRQLGVLHVLPADAEPDAVAEALVLAAARAPMPVAGAPGDPRSALPLLGDPDESAVPLLGSGQVVAVWGPTGAPGRTTVAVGLADEAARLGVSTLLVDADPYGGVVAQVLGVLDESPGLAAAARLDNQGGLDVPALARLARGLGPTLRLLSGISRADRWPEMRPDAVRGVLDRARSLASLVVVDCGFCLEQDEELSYDTMAPRRNGATLAALETADVVLAVGAADPIGIHRLVRGLADLRDAVPSCGPRVLVNKLRRGVVPGEPGREVTSALQRFAGVDDVDLLPYDRVGLDRALSVGRTLAETVPTSPLRKALVPIAARLIGARLPAEAGRVRR